MKKLSVLISILLMIFLTACEMGVKEIQREKQLVSISVDTEGANLKYDINQKFDSTGIKVFGYYSDNTKKEEDMRLVTFDKFDSSKPNESLPIDVWYKGLVTSFNVKINDNIIKEINTVQPPKKLFYQLGEKLDTTGLTINATYSNESIVTLNDDEYEISGFDSRKYGDCSVTVTLKSDLSITSSFTVHIRNYNIERLSINPPNRSIYMVGEELNLDGLEVNATMKGSGSTMTLNSDEYIITPSSIKNLEPADNIDIIISVNDIETSFSIKIVESYVKNVAVTMKDTKDIITQSPIMYYVGDTFKFKQYDYYELLSNGDLGEQITVKNEKFSNLKCEFDEKTIEKEGIQTINVEYTFFSVEANDIVTKINQFEIYASDSDLNRIEAYWTENYGYPLGIEPPDNSNPQYGSWTINAIFRDETTKTIDPKYCTFEYNIKPEKKAIFEDNKNKFKFYPVKVSFFDTRSNKTYYTYQDVKVIEPILKGVSIETLPKTEYYVGETFDISKLQVKLTYSGDSAPVIYHGDGNGIIQWNKHEGLELNDKSITLTFDNQKTLALPIVVNSQQMTGITVRENANGCFNFRKEREYTTEQYMNCFDVYPILNGNPNLSSYAIVNKELLYFSLKENGKVYVIYTNGDISYSYLYKYDRIKIVPSLPQSINISLQEPEKNKYSSIENLLYDVNTKYSITYKDNTKSVCSIEANKNEFSDDVGTYKISPSSDKEKIIVEFTAKDKAYCEDNNITLTFEIPFIKGISMKPKDDYSELENRKFRSYHNGYNYNKYFDVFMEFTNGQHQKLNDQSDVIYTPIWSELNATTSSGPLIARYTSENNDYSCFHSVTYTPALPTNVEIILPQTNSCSINELVKNCKYRIHYEDGKTKEFSSNSENTTPEQFITFDEIENESSAYKKYILQANISNYYNALEDPDFSILHQKKEFRIDSLNIQMQNENGSPEFTDGDSSEIIKKFFTVAGNYKIMDEATNYSYKETIPNEVLNYTLVKINNDYKDYFFETKGTVKVTYSDDTSINNTINVQSVRPNVDNISGNFVYDDKKYRYVPENSIYYLINDTYKDQNINAVKYRLIYKQNYYCDFKINDNPKPFLVKIEKQPVNINSETLDYKQLILKINDKTLDDQKFCFKK